MPHHLAPPWTSQSWHETDEWGENSPLIRPFSWLGWCASHTPPHPNLAALIWVRNGQMRGAIPPCSSLALLRVACSLHATQLQHLRADWGVKMTNEGEVLPRLSPHFPGQTAGSLAPRMMWRGPHVPCCSPSSLVSPAFGLCQTPPVEFKVFFWQETACHVSLTATTTINKRQPPLITARFHQMPPKRGTKTGCKSAPAVSKDEAQISYKRISSIGDETAPK